MKKFFGALVVAALTVLACVAMVGCGGTSYNGEYKYEAHGHTYGVKVEVVVSGYTIDSVKIVESDYVQLSDANPDYGWTEDSRKNYTDNEANFLKSFEGKKVADVKAYAVKVTDGAPDKNGITASGLDLITNATQSCGRVILAVQNALKDVK